MTFFYSLIFMQYLWNVLNVFHFYWLVAEETQKVLLNYYLSCILWILTKSEWEIYQRKLCDFLLSVRFLFILVTSANHSVTTVYVLPVKILLKLPSWMYNGKFRSHTFCIYKETHEYILLKREEKWFKDGAVGISSQSPSIYGRRQVTGHFHSCTKTSLWTKYWSMQAFWLSRTRIDRRILLNFKISRYLNTTKLRTEFWRINSIIEKRKTQKGMRFFNRQLAL